MYYIAIIHKEKDSAFGVSFPDFQGCITAGDTMEEAKDNAIAALNFHIEGMIEDGNDIPAPSTLDAIYANPDFANGAAFLVEATAADKTTRINITLKQSQLAQIDAIVQERGITRSALMVESTLGG